MALPDLGSIIISSRVRLARNVSGHPFPHRISRDQGLALTKKIVDAVMPAGDFKVYMVSSLPKIDSMVMHEKHLVSRELIERCDFSAVMLSGDEAVSIMVNEKDHIREQCILPGLSIDACFGRLAGIDEHICSSLDIAFDETLGFLSSNIASVGTGMKASVLMFLPGLSITGGVESMLANFAPQGMSVTGIYGKETLGQGYFYVISNTRELGRSEREILGEVMSYAMSIAEAELRARERLKASSFDDVLDLVMRAWGVITNAHKLSLSELMKLAGDLKLGASLGLVAFKDQMILDKIVRASMPFTLQKTAGTEMGELERDKARAKTAALTLKNMRIK